MKYKKKESHKTADINSPLLRRKHLLEVKNPNFKIKGKINRPSTPKFKAFAKALNPIKIFWMKHGKIFRNQKKKAEIRKDLKLRLDKLLKEF